VFDLSVVYEREIFKKHTKLNVFVEIEFDSLGIVMILNALKDNNTIRELRLTQNTLGDEGVNALCEMLKTVCSSFL
jgi:Ran GTPase-activating protein (RanGAP) involved in mRNA processing and transport